MPVTTHRVSMIGFAAFERATLESFFRVAEQRARRAATAQAGADRRQRGYAAATTPADAEIVLIDGDSVAAVQQAPTWPGRCLTIGGRGDLPGAIGHLPRPINMIRLMELLDRTLDKREATAPLLDAPTIVVDIPLPGEDPIPSPAVMESPVTPIPVEPPSAPARILVVDDSDIALRFMARCLARHNLAVELAHTGEEALQRVAEGHFEFVFLDVTMPGIDGYQTCKLIKKRPYPPGRRPPKVVMLTSRSGMVDKMRGTLAGCDAYLTKPLQQEELFGVIGARWIAAQQAQQPVPSLPAPAAPALGPAAAAPGPWPPAPHRPTLEGTSAS